MTLQVAVNSWQVTPDRPSQLLRLICSGARKVEKLFAVDVDTPEPSAGFSGVQGIVEGAGDVGDIDRTVPVVDDVPDLVAASPAAAQDLEAVTISADVPELQARLKGLCAVAGDLRQGNAAVDLKTSSPCPTPRAVASSKK